MKKIIALVLVALLLLAAFFIPVTRQKTILIKSSFFNVYKQLANADNWKKWRPDIRQLSGSDSTKITQRRDKGGFTLKFAGVDLHVSLNGYTFTISELKKREKLDYNFTVIPQKLPDYTSIVVTEKISLLQYLAGLTSDQTLRETRADDLKIFMEDPDLYYGIKITKTTVKDTNIVVLKKVVLTKNKFIEATKSFTVLKQFIAAQDLKQTQPVIAQFFQKSGDSTEVNVGIPINGKASKAGAIEFLKMPKTGSLYTATFHGKFSERMNIYTIVQKFFSDRQLAMPLLPFETYLDNKLPQNDSDIINIQINFSTY